MEYEEFYQLITVPNPGAGNSVFYKIPGETWTLVRFAHVVLTTSATVANRTPYLDYLNGDGLTCGRFECGSNQAASLAQHVTWGGALSTTPPGGTPDQQASLESVMLPPGFAVQISALNLQAGDAFTNAFLYVCRAPSAEWAQSPGAVPYSPDVIGYIG